MNVVKNLDSWFAQKLQGLQCTPETTGYIVSVLGKRSAHWEQDNLSDSSLVIAYKDALTTGDFSSFRRIGDWVLFIDAVYPEFIKDNKQIVESIGRQSYYSCWRILRGQWRLYEELADKLPVIVSSVRHKLV